MTRPEHPVQQLTKQDCWDFLAAQPVGRLAVAIGGEPYVFPVNHVVAEGGVVFRTAEGSKLLAITLGGRVAYEVDSWDGQSGSSVVARGVARELTGAEREAAEDLDLRPWVLTRKVHYVRIDVDGISGRRFSFGFEPEEQQFT